MKVSLQSGTTLTKDATRKVTTQPAPRMWKDESYLRFQVREGTFAHCFPAIETMCEGTPVHSVPANVTLCKGAPVQKFLFRNLVISRVASQISQQIDGLQTVQPNCTHLRTLCL